METPSSIHHFRLQEEIRVIENLIKRQHVVVIAICKRQQSFSLMFTVSRALRSYVVQKFTPVRFSVPVEIDIFSKFSSSLVFVLSNDEGFTSITCRKKYFRMSSKARSKSLEEILLFRRQYNSAFRQELCEISFGDP